MQDRQVFKKNMKNLRKNWDFLKPVLEAFLLGRFSLTMAQIEFSRLHFDIF